MVERFFDELDEGFSTLFEVGISVFVKGGVVGVGTGGGGGGGGGVG